jgi:RNA polymerase sigma-70 factor (ECF subfamily)
MSDEAGDLDALLARLLAGDAHALAELFSRFREQLRRMVALRLDPRLQGRLSPSDVLQEAYIDAMKRLGHYLAKPDLPFFGWLRLVVGQRLVELHRQHLGARMRNAGREIALAQGVWPAASSVNLAAHLAGNLTSPSEAAVRNESVALLERTLDQMHPLDREVLALRHFEELSNSEVAEILGIQKKAASKRYLRALARFRDALKDVPGFFPEPP